MPETSIHILVKHVLHACRSARIFLHWLFLCVCVILFFSVFVLVLGLRSGDRGHGTYIMQSSIVTKIDYLRGFWLLNYLHAYMVVHRLRQLLVTNIWFACACIAFSFTLQSYRHLKSWLKLTLSYLSKCYLVTWGVQKLQQTLNIILWLAHFVY